MQTSPAKNGDDGYTDIIGGKRLPKNHPIVECLGTIDELNAFLGDAKSMLGDIYIANIIDKIQKDLYVLMGVIAGMPVPADGMGKEYLVAEIKKLESELPSFVSFVVPGASPASARLHIARTVCRRAERRMIGLGLDEKTETAVIPYINRLSNLLFLLAQKEAGSSR